MSDRERIARAMYDWDWDEDSASYDMAEPDYLARADAVLAAIGDRLMPEIPDGVGSLHAIKWTDGWQATVIHDDGTEQLSTRRGVPPAAAIRNALEDTHG